MHQPPHRHRHGPAAGVHALCCLSTGGTERHAAGPSTVCLAVGVGRHGVSSSLGHQRGVCRGVAQAHICLLSRAHPTQRSNHSSLVPRIHCLLLIRLHGHGLTEGYLSSLCSHLTYGTGRHPAMSPFAASGATQAWLMPMCVWGVAAERQGVVCGCVAWCVASRLL